MDTCLPVSCFVAKGCRESIRFSATRRSEQSSADQHIEGKVSEVPESDGNRLYRVSDTSSSTLDAASRENTVFSTAR